MAPPNHRYLRTLTAKISTSNILYRYQGINFTIGNFGEYGLGLQGLGTQQPLPPADIAERRSAVAQVIARSLARTPKE